MAKILYSVDSLIIKDNIIYSYGWIFDEEQEITKIQLRLTGTQSGKIDTHYISAKLSSPRTDVQNAYKGQPHARNSGYLVYGAFSPIGQIKSVDIVCTLEDGDTVYLSVPSTKIQLISDHETYSNVKQLPVELSPLFKRAINHVLNGEFSTLVKKIKRYVQTTPNYSLSKKKNLIALIQKYNLKNFYFIIDHNLGGGANQYSDRLIKALISENKCVLTFTYNINRLAHVLILQKKGICIRVQVPSKDFVLDALKGHTITNIIYNNAVSFKEPQEIPLFILRLKEYSGAHLKVLLHDFFPVCPSHFLLDKNRSACSVPEIKICSGCLPDNQEGFASLYIQRDILKWRSNWGELLSESDEIIVFSRNSMDLMLKAYPKVDRHKILVAPHKVNYLTKRSPIISNVNDLCIGIVGQIGHHKGAKFIKHLSEEIKRRELGVKIVVLGVIEASCDPNIVTELGSYTHDNLAELIENSGANTFLFPSIWPETFSYVTEELIQMHLPVACFNIGAPAERLTDYNKGLILSSMSPAQVLDDMISFHRQIYIEKEA